ncbi:hypothetical protein FD754_019895 [Muntiacus muntjak]|uniref:Katanin p80 subunit C-terminal domain-containing protein n=1 Tax=Muntiacus muntjak TaxID=9888 RepID=A0A5N3V1S9_MUNMU|nr:hypothetical protein FD754_019895 [Muntiacus muntjak]
MASETHSVKKRNFCNNIEDHSIDLPRKRTSNFTNKNMKGVKKSPKQLAAYITRIVGQAVKSPDKLCKVYRRKKTPKSGGCVMTNKENELACAGHLLEKLRHDKSSSSKYSGFFSEVSQDHETMAQRSISELVAYLIRIDGLGVVVDCLPMLTKSLQEEKQYISLGCCVDLLPLVKWWSELSPKTEIVNDGNMQILKQQLSGLWEQENHLTLVPGYTGNISQGCRCLIITVALRDFIYSVWLFKTSLDYMISPKISHLRTMEEIKIIFFPLKNRIMKPLMKCHQATSH